MAFDPTKMSLPELREYAQVIVRAGYGNEFAQAALKKLAE